MIRNHIISPLIIIGMHRSGTSMVADALNRAGVFMGVFREHNGEALHFLSLNQQLLGQTNASWLSPEVPTGDAVSSLSPEQIYAEHVKSLSSNPLRLRLFYALKWGWKDPRNTFTLPVWLAKFPQAKVLHVIRDGRAVALSLQNRNKVKGEVYNTDLDDLAFNFKLWEQYVKQGLSYEAKLGNSYLQIKYEDIARGNSFTLSSLKNFTGIDVKPHLHLKKRKAVEFPGDLQILAAKSPLMQKLKYGS